MKTEKKSDYYDTIFKASESYKDHYSRSRYFPVWIRILNYLEHEQNILEVGCGTGQFAHMLRDAGFMNYFGFDFSKEAIAVCHTRGINARVMDAYKPSSFCWAYDVVIALEVLEHVEDILVLKNIQKQKPIIFSLPSFDDPAHLRFFRSREEIIERYSPYLDEIAIEQVSLWFLCRGVVK